MRKTTPKTTAKTAKPKAPRPLKISIHGDGIDIDATIGDGAGFKTLLHGLQNAAASGAQPQATPPPSTTQPPLTAYANAMLDLISTASPELLIEIDALLDVGKRAVQLRGAQSTATKSADAPTNGAATAAASA